MKSNKYIKEQLKCKYGKIDIFGYKPTRKYKLTVHHIKPKRDNGLTTMENCCLLRDDIHKLLNWYEQQDQANGDYINEYIKKYRKIRTNV